MFMRTLWFQLVVLGTPAEEGGGGKHDMISAGVFSHCDVSMMCHPTVQNWMSISLLSIQQ